MGEISFFDFFWRNTVFLHEWWMVITALPHHKKVEGGDNVFDGELSRYFLLTQIIGSLEKQYYIVHMQAFIIFSS